MSYSLHVHQGDELPVIEEDKPSPEACDNDHLLTESSDETSDEVDSEDECSVDSTYMSWSLTYDKTLYSSGAAVMKLPSSDLTLLQWLAMHFHLFTSHPSSSKQSFTESLQLLKRLQMDTENVLPSSYYEVRKLIQPYLVRCA